MTSLIREDVQQLIAMKNQENPVVSLYLNLNRPQQRNSELNSLLHSSMQEISADDRLNDEQKKSLQALSRQIHDALHDKIRLQPGGEMLAVFADTSGLWKELRLPASVANSQVHIGFSPYTRPLTALKNVFTRYGVLIADSREARVLTMYQGDREARHDVMISDEVPDQVRVKASMTSGGQVMAGLGDQRIQRHIQDHVQRHLKNTADKAFAIYKKAGFDRLLLASTDEQVLSSLYRHLHSYLQQRCITEFKAEPREETEVLREKAANAIQAWESAQAMQRVDQLMEEYESGGLAVLGVESVLQAINFGQVHTLVLGNGFQEKGFVCDQDRTFSSSRQTCPICGEAMRQTDDLAEDMIEAVIVQNGEVEHAPDGHEGFRPYGVGAFLRFLM